MAITFFTFVSPHSMECHSILNQNISHWSPSISIFDDKGRANTTTPPHLSIKGVWDTPSATEKGGGEKERGRGRRCCPLPPSRVRRERGNGVCSLHLLMPSFSSKQHKTLLTETANIRKTSRFVFIRLTGFEDLRPYAMPLRYWLGLPGLWLRLKRCWWPPGGTVQTESWRLRRGALQLMSPRRCQRRTSLRCGCNGRPGSTRLSEHTHEWNGKLDSPELNKRDENNKTNLCVENLSGSIFEDLRITHLHMSGHVLNSININWNPIAYVKTQHISNLTPKLEQEITNWCWSESRPTLREHEKHHSKIWEVREHPKILETVFVAWLSEAKKDFAFSYFVAFVFLCHPGSPRPWNRVKC